MASLLPEAADLVDDSLNLIRALLVLGHVLHADETTTRIGSVRRWLHVACTDILTLLHLAPRSRAGSRLGRGAAALPRHRWSTTRFPCMPATPTAPTSCAVPT